MVENSVSEIEDSEFEELQTTPGMQGWSNI